MPVGIDSFRSLSSFPMAWAGEKVHEKTWSARELPNEDSFQKVRDYSDFLINQVKKGATEKFVKKLTMREFSTCFAPEWWTKIVIKNHSIDQEKCIGCGVCAEKCPVDAIDPGAFKVNTDACVLCFGCINNCKSKAVNMEYSGEKMISFAEFMKKYKLKLYMPEELSTI